MPVVGPPVRTAIPCGFCHDSGPSITVANRPYACFGSIRLRSIGTENGSGTSPIPSIRCWPMMTPALPPATMSTMLTTATADR